MAPSESCEAIVVCATMFVIAVAKLREETGVKDLHARIGVHSGSVVAGVVGHTMVRGRCWDARAGAPPPPNACVRWLRRHSRGSQPRYQLFGRAVDIVQAMERTSRPGECHASLAVVKELLGSSTFTLYDQCEDGSAFVRRREET